MKWESKKKSTKYIFLEQIKNNKPYTFLKKYFHGGKIKSFNNIDLDKKYPMEDSRPYCRK